MELVDRYINAVQRYLPEDKRTDIGRELSSHLLDQLESQQDELGRKLTDDEVAATLQLWGHPRQVAATYVPPTPLVSSELMPVYKQTLIYVFGLIFLLQCLGSSIHFLQTDYFKTLQFLMQLLFGFFDSAATAFMVVTLLFYAYSAGGADNSWLLSKQWRVQDLPSVSRPWQQMSAGDLLTDLATSAFLLIVLWYPLWMSAETLASIRVALNPEIQQWVPWLSALLVVSVLANLWWVWRPYWTKLTLSINVVLNLGFSLSFLLLWLSPALLVGTDNPLPTLLTIADLDRVLRNIFLLAGLFCIYEVGRDLYRLRQLSR
ncbi:hypothetical protein A5320_16415 [Rheinheimera sp. SA_1]|uniref:hypothetical protein n=1 Tax=Rheinheimera sp. SA_1 TaxID=1827365 RepID=UPI0008017854|nr:hypothetical protein [Rheinheimera sp. SA_1]OBP14218.1 hypothetical protein A5320_16415 [Rheinheimera sp. SA_1]